MAGGASKAGGVSIGTSGFGKQGPKRSGSPAASRPRAKRRPKRNAKSNAKR